MPVENPSPDGSVESKGKDQVPLDTSALAKDQVVNFGAKASAAPVDGETASAEDLAPAKVLAEAAEELVAPGKDLAGAAKEPASAEGVNPDDATAGKPADAPPNGSVPAPVVDAAPSAPAVSGGKGFMK
jgi:hypothetical protein